MEGIIGGIGGDSVIIRAVKGASDIEAVVLLTEICEQAI
jgi:hypothetical protein